MLPDPQEFDRVTVSQPIGYDIISALSIFVARNIGEADLVLIMLGLNDDLFT